MTFAVPDVLGLLHDHVETPLASASNGSEVDFYVAGGCKKIDLTFKASGFDTNDSLAFAIEEWNGSAWVATSVGFTQTADGQRTVLLDNRVVTGSKMRVTATPTLNTATGLTVQVLAKPRQH